MKRFTILVALVLAMAGFTLAQKSALNKITPELQAELDKRPDADEMFRIIIVMADEYDQNQMSRQIQFLDKAERRAYVIDELQRFSKASQYDLIQLLEEGTKANSVSDVNPFWIFNGIGCLANREMIATLSQRKDIDCIESDEVRHMLPEKETQRVIMEPTRDNAWHVTQVHANDVWNLGYDGTGVVVAIIDTGVNYNHADLADHMWNGGSQYPHHGYDYCSTMNTWGNTTTDNDPMDENGHGSHCAGITAGDGTSGTQTGIAPNATIMAVKVFAASGNTTSTCITNGIQFAAQNGANVLSLSLGGHGGGLASYRNLFVNLMNAGIIASIAAGNEGENYISSNPNSDGNYFEVPDNVGHPGNCPPPWHNPDQTLSGGHSAVVTVGASNRNDRKTTFSSFGPCTWATGSSIGSYNDYPYTEGSSTNIGLIKPDIIAPGADIISCDYDNNSGYVSMMGTSMATPLVSGIMALMLDANPNLTPAQIDELLETTAIPADYRITKNNYTGAGRADALAVIDAILTQATKPTNLSLEVCGGNVNLSWTASTAPAGYCIYRDNVQVGTTNETTYTDENVSTGKHVYYIRANDNNGHQSVHSRAMLCTIEPYATVPENLTIGWDGAHADLGWNTSTVSNTLSSGDLYYTTNYKTSFGGTANTTYRWGIKFEPEDLRAYKGMSINQLSIYFSAKSIQHTICLYRGTTYGNTTGAPVYTQTYTSNSTGWKTVTLDSPYALTDITEDLWITVSAKASNSYSYPIAVNDYSEHNSNCFYLKTGTSPNNVIWESLPDAAYHYACCIKAHLTRTTTYTPTYNVYLDNNSEASNLSVTNYTDQPSLHSGDNTYYVTAKVGNNESCPSNEAKIVVIDNAQLENNDINIDNSLVYLITSTGTLTANEALSSNDPDRLILEDGAQLIHSSQGVQATVKKNIAPFDNSGWNFIASPITENITPSTDNALLNNDFALFYFDQSQTLEWQNWKAEGSHHHFGLEAGKGYLYGNSDNTTLLFEGTLTSNAEATDLVFSNAATLKGFNLIGNPYPCNAYVDKSFYVLNESGLGLTLGSNPVPPCTAILVQAQGQEETATFSKTETNREPNIGISVTKADTKGNTFIDKAKVSFNSNDQLAKYDLRDNYDKLYFSQNGQDYAVACTNGENEMPLSFKAVKDGTYTLSIETEELELDYLHLIDNLMGNDIDLLVSPSYTFEAKTSDYATRFKLLFAPVCEDTNGDNEFAFINNGQLHILNDGEAQLQIIDVLGRILYDKAIQGGAEMPLNLVSGTYVLRLISADQVNTQKVVVQ